MNRPEQPRPADRGKSMSGKQERDTVISGDHTVLSGTVHAVHRGLTKISLRLVTGSRTHVRVRRPDVRSDESACLIGQRVTVRIPTEAVCLEAGLFRQGRRRWNRWVGRVVLLQREGDDAHVDVKIHGDDVILRSSQPITGQVASLRTWDTVNVVVDPTCIIVHHHMERQGQRGDSQADCHLAWHPDRDTRIVLRARLTDIRRLPEGPLLSLDLGRASVSAQITHSNLSSVEWVLGGMVQIHIGVWEAWITGSHDAMASIPCRLLYLSPSVRKTLG